jgi:hypothetical protein
MALTPIRWVRRAKGSWVGPVGSEARTSGDSAGSTLSTCPR